LRHREEVLPPRTRIVCYDSAAHRIEIARRSPPLHLREYVRDYVGGREDSATPICRREVPTGLVPVILNVAGRVRSPNTRGTWTEHTTFAAGLHESFTFAESIGPSDGLQVNFSALGARLFFQGPLHELTNRIVAIEELLGRQAESLLDELDDARTWDARFEIVDRLIERRVSDARLPCDPLVWAWRQLVQSQGRVRINFLVERIGWSEKTFVKRFRSELGLAPKSFERILRFSRAYRALVTSDGPRLTDIAYDAGYYDQAHFTNEFHAFAGVTPIELMANRLPAGAGVLVRRQEAGAMSRAPSSSHAELHRQVHLSLGAPAINEKPGPTVRTVCR